MKVTTKFLTLNNAVCVQITKIMHPHVSFFMTTKGQHSSPDVDPPISPKDFLNPKLFAGTSGRTDLYCPLITCPGNRRTKMDDCKLTKIIYAIFILPSNDRTIHQVILMNQYGLLDLLIHLWFHKVHFFSWYFCHSVVIEPNLIPKVMEDFEDFCRSILGSIFWVKGYNCVLGLWEWQKWYTISLALNTGVFSTCGAKHFKDQYYWTLRMPAWCTLLQDFIYNSFTQPIYKWRSC